jgi:hypothetical protein
MAVSAAVYRPRNPQATDYYHCVEDHLETFIQGYEERFERTCGTPTVREQTRLYGETCRKHLGLPLFQAETYKSLDGNTNSV